MHSPTGSPTSSLKSFLDYRATVRRRRRLTISAVFGPCLGAILMAGIAAPAAAQFLRTSSTADRVVDRDREYRELAQEAEFFERQSQLLRRIARLARPTVVHISAVSGNDPRYRGGAVEEAGSGVILDIGGNPYVVTNWHVVRHAVPRAASQARGIDSISIELADRRVIHPIWARGHRDTDVAVMPLPSGLSDIAAARIGDSDRLDVGDFVLAIGSPFALSQSVTFGHVSAVGRRSLDLGEDIEIQEFLQVDAAINPGNSGGPLINVRGEVVGLNTAIASSSGGSEGVGFAIPINIVTLIATQLVTRGEVESSYLGVGMERNFGPDTAVSLGLSHPRGVLVTEVHKSTPAERSGIHSRDVILEFNGTSIEDDDHLLNLVRLTPVGRSVPIVVFRDGREMALKVTLDRHPRAGESSQ